MKASVCVLAYNHEPYIEQTVRSILAQRTNFDYEIVIGEDCSTDQTLGILVSLQEQNPNRIRLLTTDRNLGMVVNFVRTYQACTGEYIAMLDGDDYWCGEDKLQKQIDFLDQHPDFDIVFHSVIKVYEDSPNQPKVIRPDQIKDSYDIHDLISSMFIPTCSALFRQNSIEGFPEWIASLKMLDWLIFLLAARRGKIGFIDDVMAVYRVQPLGVWSSMGPMNRLISIIDLFERLNPYMKYQYDSSIQTTLKKKWRKLMDELYDLAISKESEMAARDLVIQALLYVKEFKSVPPGWRQELWERIYCYYLITNFENENFTAAWAAWLNLMKNDPSLLLNRGLFLIGLQSAFNGRWRSQIQRFTRSYRSK